MPWKVVEHTADVGLEATGADLEAAIEALVAGFGGLVCPEGEVEGAIDRTVVVEGVALDDVVVDLLDEINYIHQVDRFVPATGEALLETTDDGHRLTVELAGETYDPDAHGHLMEIKATTYHGFEIERHPARIHVLFDV